METSLSARALHAGRAGSRSARYVAAEVDGDVAYTVAIERGMLRPTDGAALAPMTLRVTHVFRRERGEWRLVDRRTEALTTPEMS